jgi:hypothetical protein
VRTFLKVLGWVLIVVSAPLSLFGLLNFFGGDVAYSVGYLLPTAGALALGIWLVKGAKLPQKKLPSEDTIKCFNCGKQVADETVVCPWCNAQLRTKRGSE